MDKAAKVHAAAEKVQAHAAGEQGANGSMPEEEAGFEDMEEEEPEDDEELPPCSLSPAGAAAGAESKEDTLEVLVNISDNAGAARGRSGGKANAAAGSAATRNVNSSASKRDAQSSSNLRPSRSATAVSSPKPEDEEVAPAVMQEAVKWLLEKLYKRFDTSKLEKVPELMRKSQRHEVVLLRSALWKYVSLPEDEAYDSSGQTLEERADLLQELLMGLAEFFAVTQAPAAVALDNLGSSFLRELYQMLSQVRESRLQLSAPEPIEDAFADRPELKSPARRRSQGILGSLVREESMGIPEVPEKDVEVSLPQRHELFLAVIHRCREEWEKDLNEESVAEQPVEQPVAQAAPESRPPKRPRRGRGRGAAGMATPRLQTID